VIRIEGFEPTGRLQWPVLDVETENMAKRALRVVKNLGRIPVVAVCTVCAKAFEAPLGALVSVKDAEANLQQQFYGHKCEQRENR
jgi:hypothetical protein